MSAYAVNKVCRLVVHDEAFRDSIRERPEATLDSVSPPLEEAEKAALLAGDIGTLSRLGAHDFQLYQLQRFGVFGITLDSYYESIKEASIGGDQH